MQLLGLGERYTLASLPSLINYVDNIDEKGGGNLNSVTLNVSFLLRQGLM